MLWSTPKRTLQICIRLHPPDTLVCPLSRRGLHPRHGPGIVPVARERERERDHSLLSPSPLTSILKGRGWELERAWCLICLYRRRFEGEAKNKVWLCPGWRVAARLPSCVGTGGPCQASEVGRLAGRRSWHREPRAPRAGGERVTHAESWGGAHSSQREGGEGKVGGSPVEESLP